MKILLMTIAQSKRLTSIFTDEIHRNLHLITRRRYSEERTVGQQIGYRKVPAQGTISEHGYLLLIFPFTFTALGLWYLRKYYKTNELKESLSKLYEKEPVPLPENKHSVGQFDVLGMGMYENHPFYRSLSDCDLSDLQHRRIKVCGEFQYDKEFLFGVSKGPVSRAREMDKFHLTTIDARGYYLITPFKLQGRNYSIMINRGFLPKEAALDEETRLLSQVHGPLELTCVLRQDQDIGILRYLVGNKHVTPTQEEDMTVFMARHAENMAKYCRSARIFLDCLPQDFDQFTPVITARAEPETQNDGFMYALFWFSFAAYAAFNWYVAHKPRKTTPVVYKLKNLRR